jgi:hypothetical protein
MCGPNPLLPKFNACLEAWKKEPKSLTNFVIFKNLPKIYNRPIGENSRNLVTLAETQA